MKQKPELIHRIAFYLLNIVEIMAIVNFSSMFPNEDSVGYSLKGIIFSVILLICISIIYYSWWKLYTKDFK